MSSNHQTPSPFTAIFASVPILTIASGDTAITIANRATVNEQQERILDSAIAIWTMGTTTLIGLLSSRSSAPDDDDNDDK